MTFEDPQPGDFDAELATVDPRDVEVIEPSRDRHVTVQFTLDGDDAERLAAVSRSTGQPPSAVVRSLIRAASERAA